MNGELDRALGRLAVIADEVDARSGTPLHSARVTVLTTRLLDALRIQGDERALIAMAARVHDIGKLQVPEELLRKPGPLSKDEWSLVRLHPHFGSRALSMVPEWEMLAPLVFAHHERMDGCGYPRRLPGANIPLGARAIAIADSLDAMLSARPYQGPQSLDCVQATLLAGAGTQWDPHLVAVCMPLLYETGPLWGTVRTG
jgi:HD-GYP domain-containing protein (c-di-GMP phosphodiesterase class II)